MDGGLLHIPNRIRRYFVISTTVQHNYCGLLDPLNINIQLMNVSYNQRVEFLAHLKGILKIDKY